MSITDPSYPMNQAVQPPFEDLGVIESHIRLLEQLIEWSDVGILVDQDNRATLILLLEGPNVSALLRFCLSPDDSVEAMKMLKRTGGNVFFGAWQGHTLARNDIHSLSTIQNIWQSIPEQIVAYSEADLLRYFEQQKKDSHENQKGRNKSFNVETKRAVMIASHGRCMFEGCGENLGFEQITGTEGNFAYLAHNVGSSELGPRGVPGLSEKLSDDPSNVLLLCDKHHRLIDKVARADYPADRLSRMRRDFCEIADRLLSGLGYEAIPAFAVLWPLNRQTVSPPSPIQIAQSLSKIKARMDGQLNYVTDNEEILRASPSEVVRQLTPTAISLAANQIRTQANGNKHRAALFAFGPMPALIALGALVGNKNQVIPMLRYRDGGQWDWPADEKIGCCYEILGIDDLSSNEKEVSIILAFTADPDMAKNAANSLLQAKGIKTIKIKPKPEFVGNGSIGHPLDGIAFMKNMQYLLHKLVDDHQVIRVHVMPCASNAICVFFGQAFDKHHPELVVYDFDKKSMSAVLRITNDGEKSSVSAVENS